MKLRPLGDRVVIKKIEVEEKTTSGILLPDSVKEAPLYAEVIAIGAGILNDDEVKDEIKVGDKVIFSEFAGTDVKADGEDVKILKLSDILAVIE